MAIVGVKVSGLDELQVDLSSNDLIYVVKTLPNGEYLSVKTNINKLSTYVFDSEVRDFVLDIVNDEKQDRIIGDNNVTTILTNALNTEISNRQLADTQTLNSAKQYVDDEIVLYDQSLQNTFTTINHRIDDVGEELGDVEDRVKAYTDLEVLTAKNTLQAADNTLNTAILTLSNSTDSRFSAATNDRAAIRNENGIEQARVNGLFNDATNDRALIRSEMATSVSTERNISDNKYVEKVSGKQLSTLSFEPAERTELQSLRGDLTSLIDDEEDRAEAATLVALNSAKSYSDSQLQLHKDEYAIDLIQERSISDSKYVPITTGKQLSTLSFELTHRDAILNLNDTIAHAVDVEADLRIQGDEDTLDSAKSYTDTIKNQTLSEVSNDYVAKAVGRDLSDENFTIAEKNKLASMEGSKYIGLYTHVNQLPVPSLPGQYADVDSGVVDNPTIRYIWDDNDSEWIEQTSGAPFTAAQIKTFYESNPDTNAFTNAEKTKLLGLHNYNDIPLEGRTTTLENTTSTHGNRLTAVETDINSLQTGKADVTLTNSIQTDLNLLETTVTTLGVTKASQADVVNLSTAVSLLEGRVVSAETLVGNKADILDIHNYTYSKTESDNLLDDKVDKVAGKYLSDENFTTAEKNKLANLDTSMISELTNLYFTEGRVISTPLTGLSAGTNEAVTASDSILTAIAKLQAQIDAI